MSFGGTPKMKAPPAVAPRAVQVLPEEEKAKKDLKERLKRMRSRALSRMTGPGLLEVESPTKRPILSDLLG